jgi:hypothetical protein
VPEAQPAQTAPIDINALSQQIGAQVRAAVMPIAQEVAQLKQVAAQPRQAPPPPTDDLNAQFLGKFLNEPLKNVAEIVQVSALNAEQRIDQKLAARDAAQQEAYQREQFRQAVLAQAPDIADVESFVWQEGWYAAPSQAPGLEWQRAGEAVNYARQKKQMIVEQNNRARQEEEARKRQVSSPVGQQYAPAASSPEGQALLQMHASDGMSHLAEMAKRQNELKATGQNITR